MEEKAEKGGEVVIVEMGNGWRQRGVQGVRRGWGNCSHEWNILFEMRRFLISRLVFGEGATVA